METYFLLLGICCAPAILGSVLTFPLWFSHTTNNDTINRISYALMVLALLFCYLFVFLDDTLELGFLFIPLSLINFPLIRLYTRVLYTTRCPKCRSLSLRIMAHKGHKYELICRQCGLDITWKLWSPVPDDSVD